MSYNEFSSTETVTALFRHRCFSCSRDIRSGDRYTRRAWKCDGDFGFAKTCSECERVVDLIIAHQCDDGGIDFSDLWGQADEAGLLIQDEFINRRISRTDQELNRCSSL